MARPSISPARSPTRRRARASTEQTREILAAIDALLAEAGTDKTRILSATIYLADMATFAEMNAVWEAWVAQGATPARATVEAKLAAPQLHGRDRLHRSQIVTKRET